MKATLLRRYDLILIGALLLVAAALLLFSAKGGSCTAVVEQDGAVVRRIDLSRVARPERLELPGGYHVVLLVEPNAISFAASDCPDQICVRTGRLTKPGQAAVCLPAKISVRIVGAEKEYDGYTG